MIYNILLIIQIIVALSIIGLVLMQHGKGADAGAAFGGGASGTVFGSRGSGNFLSRATGILAAVFFANSLALAWLVSNSQGGNSVGEQSVVEKVAQEKPAPEAPKVVAPSDVPTNVGADKAEPAAEATKGDAAVPADVPTSK